VQTGDALVQQVNHPASLPWHLGKSSSYSGNLSLDCLEVSPGWHYELSVGGLERVRAGEFEGDRVA
jgi:hypothetical protein